MAYVLTVSETTATGDVARIYADIVDHLGSLPGVFKLMSADPAILRDVWNAYPYAMEYGLLDRAERELVALAVSRANACRYGVDGATARLREMGMAPRRIEGLFRADDGSEARHLALIALAENATRHPDDDLRRTVETTTAAGLGPQEVREATTVVVWFNLLNRLVDGLGVPHERADRRRPLQSLRTKAHGLATRLLGSDRLPVVEAIQEGGAGETALVLLRRILDRHERLADRLPDDVADAIRDHPRLVDRTMIDGLRSDGWSDADIFRAAVVVAGREALRRWDAVVPHLDDPLSGPHAVL